MNEYLRKFNELQEEHTFRGQQWFGKRKQLVEEYSWAVPSEEAVTYLSEFENIIEIGAGSGYWAHCIDAAGGNVFPTDISPPEDTWTDVAQAKVNTLDLEDEVVLTVWPPYGDNMSTQAVVKRPAHLLYVGEPYGGCTGSVEMFEILEDQYGLVAKLDLPSYAGVNDDLYHYVRKR